MFFSIRHIWFLRAEAASRFAGRWPDARIFIFTYRPLNQG